ncbi:MAG TPA: hypothetical protein VMU06_22210 [Stellaceae bacterium]|nr:hypothetical protein [Stellaceae bacterium]
MAKAPAKRKPARPAGGAAPVNGNGNGYEYSPLEDLIRKLNPYSYEMDIYTGNPDPSTIPNDYAQVDLEVDAKYPSEWQFKGASQRVNVAVRIKYRYPYKDKDGNFVCWIDDYLLIGYEGSGGP